MRPILSAASVWALIAVNHSAPSGPIMNVNGSAIGCGDREFAKGHRQCPPGRASRRAQQDDHHEQHASISVLHRSPWIAQSTFAPWIDQTVDTFPTPAGVTCVPFMNQIATLPLVSCQRKSLLPSPLKSPVSTIDQTVGT